MVMVQPLHLYKVILDLDIRIILFLLILFALAISHVTLVAEPGRSIINLSLTGPRSKTIDDALSMAFHNHGIPIFVSAGNSGDNACDYSPSANPDVFTVGASNREDVIPSFSSYGECVRIYAPGTNITSTWIGGQSQVMDGTR